MNKLLVVLTAVFCFLLLIRLADNLFLQWRASLPVKRLQKVVEILTRKHKDILLRKQKMNLYVDDYGETNVGRWDAEKRYFFSSVVEPKLADEIEVLEMLANLPDEITWPAISGTIDVVLNDELQTLGPAAPAINEDVAPKDPIEFEEYCAHRLSNNGWKTQLTRRVGDQGADVIAELGGKRVVAQCKLYSAPDGNNAVQEVTAAKAFHSATFGCVISNQGYTEGAKALALANKILLLHYTELDQLSVGLGIQN
jgi:restriction system protein